MNRREKLDRFYATEFGGVIYVMVVFLIAMLLATFGQFVFMSLDGLLTSAANSFEIKGQMTTADILETATIYSSFIGVWVAFVVYLLARKDDRPILNSVAYRKGNSVKALLLGFLIGFVLNGICIGAAYFHGDIHFEFRGFSIWGCVFLFILVFIQSSAEELTFRVYFLQKIRQRYDNKWVAILVTAVMFMFVHMGNEGVTIIGLLSVFAIGVLFAQIVIYFNSIWSVMAIHAAWNFTQNIIFGLPNSGVVAPYSFFTLDAANAKSTFAYSVSFGPEGSLVSVVLIGIICVALWYFCDWRKGKKETEEAE